MKLGFVSAILAELSLPEVVACARDEGFACVERMSWPAGKAERKFAGVTHMDVSDFTQAQADDVRALAAQHGVAISALGYYPNVLDPDPEVSARFMSALIQAGYDGPVCIEVEDDTFGKTLAGRQTALRVARDVQRPFFG